MKFNFLCGKTLEINEEGIIIYQTNGRVYLSSIISDEKEIEEFIQYLNRG